MNTVGLTYLRTVRCCIVCAKTKSDSKRAAHGISLFLVDADTKGFHKGRKLKKLGLKAQVVLSVTFRHETFFFISSSSISCVGIVSSVVCCCMVA